MTPEYIAKKTAWRAVTPLRVLFFWLIIPLLVIIVHLIQLKCETIEFYADRVVQRESVLAKKTTQAAFNGVIGVSVDQSIIGRIFNYGDVKIDIVGKWDIDTQGISNPKALQRYLEGKLIRTYPYATNTIIG